MSIISSWSAANAIQQMLKLYNLPNLKVLLDYRIDSKILKSLENIGCEIYETDLSKKILNSEDILKLTDNIDGIDITSDDSLWPYDIFYDWLSYDVVNQSADYVFVPYWTWHLFENITNVAVKESKNFFKDKRLRIESDLIKRCNFLWATTNNPDTKADKLYSPHLPFVHFDKSWIKLAISKWYIWKKSNVYTVQEKNIDKAMQIAKDNKIDCEPSWIAWLWLMIQLEKDIDKTKKILIINTWKTKI